MRFEFQAAISFLLPFIVQTAVLADDQSAGSDNSSMSSSSTTVTETSSSSMSTSSSSSSSSTSSTSVPASHNVSPSQSKGTSNINNQHPTPGPGDEVIPIKPSITFIPKFKQRIADLGDQIRMAQSKGFITDAEATQFTDRQSKLFLIEADANKKGFPKPDLDNLEKAITLLNSDLFKAMHKNDPVKPGTSENEVNDPNLIPAYPDPELQPGSGKK